ncbi:hypothetical protein ACVWXL_004256 [Bradyrhizobium sp. GM22.5]
MAAGLHGLAGGREDRCGGKDDGTRSQRICQRSVADRSAAIDQQQVDRDDLRLELHDGVDDAGEIGARQRIAAAALHDGVVDRDDGDEIGRNPHAADLRPPIRQRRLEAIEKPQMTVGVTGIDARAPQCGEDECHQDLNASATHVVVLQFLYRPNAVRRAQVTRTIGQVLLTKSCHQRVDARLAPCLDRQRACGFHVDALATV